MVGRDTGFSMGSDPKFGSARMHRPHVVRLWRWPAALAFATVLGLLADLYDGDAISRWLCWLSLALPLVIAAHVLSPAAPVRKDLDA